MKKRQIFFKTVMGNKFSQIHGKLYKFKQFKYVDNALYFDSNDLCQKPSQNSIGKDEIAKKVRHRTWPDFTLSPAGPGLRLKPQVRPDFESGTPISMYLYCFCPLSRGSLIF